MSKKRRRPQANTQARPAQPNKKTTDFLSAFDSFINNLAYLGEANKLEQANDYERHGITRDYETLTVMYRENWLTKRIIDLPCEDMTRAWYSISSEIEQDKLDEIAKLEAKHNVKQEVTNMLRWARLYGGAAAVMVIKGQEDMLEQPLDFDTLVPGCFHGLIVVDRTNGLYPSIELEEDMDDPDYGYPKYYNVITDSLSGESLRVHHSRLLMARGRMLPIQEEINEDYWGASEIEHIYEELQKRNATSANIAQLVFQANVSAMKIGNFGEAMATGTDQMKEKIMQAIFDMNRIKNSSGLLVMGSEDNYEQHPYSFAGIAEVYEAFMLDMAGAAEIPATKLFGRSPQGMNATGESDMNNYYEKLAQLQELQLRPAIEKLLPVMAMSLWGEIPEDMEIVFKPLATTTPAERAEIMSKQAATVVQVFSAGIISQKMALRELQEQGKSIGAWTNITDEDIDRADDEFDTGEGMEDPMGMMGPGGPEGMPPMQPEAPEAPEAEQPPEEEIQPEQDERTAKIHELKERIQKLRARGEEETEDGGPGSGPRPGYHKKSAGLAERAAFMANPTAGMREVRQPQRTAASVERANKEREDWSNLSLHQKVEGNAQQERHMRKVKAQVAKLAAKGDIEGAKKIVQQNRHYWSNDPASAEKVQSETLKRQKAVKSGFIGDTLRALASLFRGKDWQESQHPRGKGGKFAPKGSGSVSGSGESEGGTVKSSEPLDNNPQTEHNRTPKEHRATSGWSQHKNDQIQVSGPAKSKEFIRQYMPEHPEVAAEVPKYKGVLEKVRTFSAKEPGTYSAITGEKLDIPEGYSVTFHQNMTAEDPYGAYTDDDYAAMCAIAKHELGSDDVYIGFFGNPEVSFLCKDEKTAKKFAIEHNQHSIWNNWTNRLIVNRKKYRPDLNPIRDT